jgi:hypothetical protein
LSNCLKVFIGGGARGLIVVVAAALIFFFPRNTHNKRTMEWWPHIKSPHLKAFQLDF